MKKSARRWSGRSLHPQLAEDARAIVAELRKKGISAVITSGYRSLAKQRQLYNRYKRGGPLAAAPGRSAHNYGLAVDIALVGEPVTSRKYSTMHRIARGYGLTTLQGDQLRVDPYHLEVPNWRRLVPPQRST